MSPYTVKLTFLFIVLLGSSVLVANDTLEKNSDPEVLIKSYMSLDNKQVLIDITLPDSDDVGFELYTSEDQIIHLWNEQYLEKGRHKISLKMPALVAGKYLLEVLIGENTYKQMVYIR